MWQILNDFKEINFEQLAADQGTPLYLYSGAFIRERFRRYRGSINGRPLRIHYAVKANGNLSILRLLHQLGAGFDIVSVGELERVLLAGAPARLYSHPANAEAATRWTTAERQRQAQNWPAARAGSGPGPVARTCTPSTTAAAPRWNPGAFLSLLNAS